MVANLTNSSSQDATEQTVHSSPASRNLPGAADGTDDIEGEFVSQLHPAQDTHIAACREPTDNEGSTSQSNDIGVLDASSQVTQRSSLPEEDRRQNFDKASVEQPAVTTEPTISASPPRTSTETITDSGFYGIEEVAAEAASVNKMDSFQEDELECFTYFIHLCETDPSEDETNNTSSVDDTRYTQNSRKSQKRKSQSFIPRRSLPPAQKGLIVSTCSVVSDDAGDKKQNTCTMEMARKRHSTSERELVSPGNESNARLKRSSLPIPTTKMGTLQADIHCVKLKASAVRTDLDARKQTRLPVHRSHQPRVSNLKSPHVTAIPHSIARTTKPPRGATKLPVLASGGGGL